jgi:hypothetical protein
MCVELSVMGSMCQQKHKNCVDVCLSRATWAVRTRHRKQRCVPSALLNRLAGELLQRVLDITFFKTIIAMHAVKAYRGRRSVTALILDLDTG